MLLLPMPPAPLCWPKIGQDFHQGLGRENKHKYSVQYYPASWNHIDNQQVQALEPRNLLLKGPF